MPNEFPKIPYLSPEYGQHESGLAGISLPERNFASGYCYYGAPSVAADYCGLPREIFSSIKGVWVHGWHPPEHNIHPEWVVGTTGLSRQVRDTQQFWVARQDQADYLKSCGYRYVEAVGMPIIYLPQPAIKRELNSLLVMPVHSLASTRHNWDFERYADEIVKIKGDFSRVVVCVHPDCIANNYWAPSFLSRGIPVISGAHVADQNSLLRMATLFMRFDYITTNGFGSHLAYGAYFGARPSIYGTVAQYQPDDFKDDMLYSNCSELLPLVIEFLSNSNLTRTYANLFRYPKEATTLYEWGAFQVGYQHKCTSYQLRKLFKCKKILKFYTSKIFSFLR